MFLLDGTVTGAIKATLPNWTGVVYKIPRTAIENCKKRPDLQQSGVYFLFGKSDEQGENVVYIGQAGFRKKVNGLLGRILDHAHDPEEDYWTEVVAITTANDSFGPTEISYLENQFTKLANDAKRYIVKNEREPNPGNITEEKECELEEFIEYARIVTGILGHKVFVPLNETTSDNPEHGGEILHLRERGADATGFRTSDGFVVCRGSVLKATPTQSCPEWIKELREKYVACIDERFILSRDIVFDSPSGAAGFCVYGSANGRIAWITESGQTLKSLESEI